jgi:hypothetical protein
MYALLYDSGRTACVAPERDSDGSIVPCLRIGRVHVGKVRTDLEEQLGLAPRILPQRLPNLTTVAYVIDADSARDRATYYVLEYERVAGDELLFSAQLTGDPADMAALDFSCLKLGTSEAAVHQQLGAPSEVRPFEAPHTGVAGVVWSYDPLPISIEFVDGKVYSFRVWRPGDVPARKRTLSLLEKR